MTNDALKGRELDRTVALTVMGWKLEIRTRKSVKDGATVLHWQIENPIGFWWDLEQSEKEAASTPATWWCDAVGLPHYGTDLDAARGVVKRLEELGWTSPEKIGDDVREFSLAHGNSKLHFDIKNRKEAPAVICRAALKAVEVVKAK